MTLDGPCLPQLAHGYAMIITMQSIARQLPLPVSDAATAVARARRFAAADTALTVAGATAVLHAVDQAVMAWEERSTRAVGGGR